MQVLGDTMSSLEDRINTATAIGSGLATYQATGDIEQAANVGKTVKDKGIGTAAGDYVADTTGSPLLATAVSMVPEAIDAVAGTKLAGKIPGQQFEMGDIGGQKFGQRGAVGGVDDGKKGFASSEVTRDIDIDDFGDEIEGDPYVLINKVEVPEEHRGQGVGRKLMEKEIAEQSRANPDLPFELAAIPLDDATDVNKLVGFYESMGFREPVSDYDLDFTHMKMTAPQAKKIADKYYEGSGVNQSTGGGVPEGEKLLGSSTKLEFIRTPDGKIMKRSNLGAMKEKGWHDVTGGTSAANALAKHEKIKQHGSPEAAEAARVEQYNQLKTERDRYNSELESNETYKMQHEAPMLDSNPSAVDLNNVFPDIYTGQGLNYYATGMDYDGKAINIIKSMNANPNKAITAYRAVPEGVTDFNAGDWITTTKEYARDHIGDDKGYHIITKKIKPSEMASDGNSIHEFGYDPRTNK